MNFETVAVWECQVVSTHEAAGTFNYQTCQDDATLSAGGTLRLNHVPSYQLPLVQPGAKFLCIIGVVLGSGNTSPMQAIYFPDPSVLGAASIAT